MINWTALLTVQLVSLGATLAVVTLVSLAVLGLSARGAASTPGRQATPLSARYGTAVGAVSLAVAAAIVLFGLWQIVAR
jgi:hypothetical protein